MSDKPSNELAHWPPHTEHCQEVSGGEGEKLQKQCPINRQVTTNTKTHTGTKTTDSVDTDQNKAQKALCMRWKRTYPIQVGLPPIASPKTPQRKRVMLKARRRPTISEITPQNDAPIQRPRNSAHVVNRTLDSETSNSRDNWVSVRAIPCT